MKAKPQSHGRILFAQGRVCQMFMRPYSTDGWVDVNADQGMKAAMRIANEFQRQWTFNGDNLHREYPDSALSSLGKWNPIEHTFQFGASTRDGEQRKISFSSPAQLQRRDKRSVLQINDSRTSELQGLFTKTYPEGWRDNPYGTGPVRNDIAQTPMITNTFSLELARVMMKAREGAGQNLYERMFQQQRYSPWQMRHLLECGGYFLKPEYQHIARDEGWVRADWQPSPRLKAVDNRVGQPEKPLFSAPYAPHDVLFDMIPHLVDDHNPTHILDGSVDVGRLRLTETITVNARDHVSRGEPLEAIQVLHGKQPVSRPFCAFTDSTPLSPMSVIVFNRENKPRRFLVPERRFSDQFNCCMGGKHYYSGKPTCYGCPDDRLCRAVLARDYLYCEPTHGYDHPLVETPVPFLCPVMCTGCAIVMALSGYASDNEQLRAFIMLTITYDLRNKTDREPTWSPPVQPLAMYQHRLKELLAKAPVTFDGKEYTPDMFDHYCYQMIEGTHVGRMFARLLWQKYHDFMMYDPGVVQARGNNWRLPGDEASPIPTAQIWTSDKERADLIQKIAITDPRALGAEFVDYSDECMPLPQSFEHPSQHASQPPPPPPATDRNIPPPPAPPGRASSSAGKGAASSSTGKGKEPEQLPPVPTFGSDCDDDEEFFGDTRVMEVVETPPTTPRRNAPESWMDDDLPQYELDYGFQRRDCRGFRMRLNLPVS